MSENTEFFASLPRAQQIGFAAGAVALLLAAVVAVVWALAPRNAPLYGGLAPEDATAVVGALDRWGVAYDLSEDGRSVLVAEGDVPAVRMRLAREGLPGKSSVGFELFDDAGYGMTEFTQRINYQRGLQGELERTIDALDGVARARVHLTLRRGGLFPSESAPPKASVTLDLEPGTRLGAAEIEGIRLLVSGAVEGLDAESVAVLDGAGRPLAGDPIAGADAGDRGAVETARAAELERRIGALLGDVFDLQRFSVSVDVRMNFDKVREVRDEVLAQPDGAGAVTRRRQSETRPDAKAGARGSTITESDFEHGRSHQERVYAPGRVERVSVAVLVPRGLDAATQQRLREVIAAAIGLDAARGDRIEIGALGVERVPATSKQAPAAVSTRPAPESTSVLVQVPWFALGMGMVLLALVALVAFAFVGGPRLSAAERDAIVTRVQRFIDEGSSTARGVVA